MLGAIFTSLSGMNAYKSGLDTISNNVANMNTPGFKLSDPLFRDLVYQYGGTIGNGNSATQSKGAGVHAGTATPSLQQGELRDTGNSLDAAIDGSGFFVLEQDGRRIYTRAGQFEFDKDGILVERSSGAHVLVSTSTSSSGSFDLNTMRVFAPRATAEVTLSGALMRSTAASSATAYSLPQIKVYDTTGAPVLLTAKLTPDSTATPARATTEVKLSGALMRDAAGGAASAYSLGSIQVFDSTGASIPLSASFTPDAADPLHWTVDILDANNIVQGSGDVRFNADGTPAISGSSFPVTVSTGAGSAFNVTFNFGAPLTSDGVTSVSGTATSQLQVLSQDGAAAVNGDPLHWSVDILDEKNVVQGSGDLRFNDDGTPATGGSEFTVTVKPTSGPSFEVKINFGAPGTYAGVSSVVGTTTSQLQLLKQDGVQLGTITKTEFDEKGQLKITYSNGEDRTPMTLILAQFDSPDQLQTLGGSRFAAVDQHEPRLGSALNMGLGRIAGGKLEMSNVDLTNQFTDLIIVQRGFQGSSQIASVANEMMQQLLSMSGNR